MTGPLVSAWLSHWWRHPGQLLTLVLGLSLATALWTGVQAINGEARAAYDRAAAALSANDLPRLVPQDGPDLSVDTYVALRRAGWPVAPVIEGVWRVSGDSYRLIGLDPLTAPALPAPTGAGDDDPGPALLQFIIPPGELRGHPVTLAELGDIAPRKIATEDVPPGTLVADVGVAAELLGRPGRLSHLLILSPPGQALPPLAAIAPELTQVPPPEGTDIRGLTDSFHLNLTAFGFLGFVVGLVIVHSTVRLAFEQRRATVRTLRALGTPLRGLIVVVGAEALVLALLAGGVGVAMGYGIAAVLLPDVAATLRGLYGAPVTGGLSVRPEWAMAGMAMALFGAMIATAETLWALARLPVLAPAQPRAWALASLRRLHGVAAVGTICLIAAALLTVFGTGLIAGFAALGALLLGAALGLPVVLVVLTDAAGSYARRPIPQWLWADARQQVPGLSLALMALLLALSANIGVTTMVASFRTTFEGWLDQRLSAEMYLRFDTETQAETVLSWLAARPETAPPNAIKAPPIPRIEILPIPRTAVDLGGAPGTLYGMRDHPTYRDAWPMLAAVPQVWDRLAAGDGVLINEQWSYRDGLRPGARATIDGRAVEVLGIYSDYGNPRAQAVLGLSRFHAAYPQAQRLQYAVRVDPGAVQDLTQTLIDTFALRPDQIVDQHTLKTTSRQVFARTFAATDALNVLTLAVAGFAMFASLLSLQSLRLPQVAPLWAMGLQRGQIAALDLLRTGALALATAAVALPVGLALAWLLLARINVWAFGWRLPMQAFPGDWAILMAVACLAALAAAGLPALRLARTRPADLLRVFSHAR